jgi:hypothetical protein
MMNDGEGGAIAAAHPDVVEGVGDHGSGKLLPCSSGEHGTRADFRWASTNRKRIRMELGMVLTGDSDKARWRGCRS